MDIWIPIATWVEAHLQILGPPISVSAWLAIALPLLIAQTPHARAQTPPVSGFPIWPGSHFRLLGYAFSREAYEAGGWYARTLLRLYRAALIVAGLGVILMFAVFLSLDPTLALAP